MSQELNSVQSENLEETVSNQKKKINYKEVFLNLVDGDNLMRIVDLTAKKLFVHWVKDTTGKPRSIKCPGAGCPCCAKNEAKTEKRFYKVADKMCNLRVVEVGPQIFKQLKQISADLKEEDKNLSLTQRDIIIKKDPAGKPLYYQVKLVKANATPSMQEQMRVAAISEAVAKDTLDLGEIIKPWTVERINEQIYGNGAATSTPEATPQTAQEDEDFTVFNK
jgi:hypothetical protein